MPVARAERLLSLAAARPSGSPSRTVDVFT